MLEAVKPARPITYRKFSRNDLGAVVMYTVFFQMAVVITDRIPVPKIRPGYFIRVTPILEINTFFYRGGLWLVLGASFYAYQTYLEGS